MGRLRTHRGVATFCNDEHDPVDAGAAVMLPAAMTLPDDAGRLVVVGGRLCAAAASDGRLLV